MALPISAEIDAGLVTHRQSHDSVNLGAVRVFAVILSPRALLGEADQVAGGNRDSNPRSLSRMGPGWIGDLVAGPAAFGGTVYVHGAPICSYCAGVLIQAGIVRAVAKRPCHGTGAKTPEPMPKIDRDELSLGDST